MTDSEKEGLIRLYAAGGITWHDLQERGFDDFIQVLGALGELGLRQPIAEMVAVFANSGVDGCGGHGMAPVALHATQAAAWTAVEHAWRLQAPQSHDRPDSGD